MGYLPAVVALLGAAIEQGAENVQVVLMPFQKSLIRCMTLIAEQCSVSGGYGIDVLHYASVAKAYLQVKADHEPVMDGEYVFEVIGREKVRLWCFGWKGYGRKCRRGCPGRYCIAASSDDELPVCTDRSGWYQWTAAGFGKELVPDSGLFFLNGQCITE